MSCRPPAPVCRLIVDPVGSGYVVSMARPGGNATGFTSIEMSLIPKARACRDQRGRGVKGAIRVSCALEPAASSSALQKQKAQSERLQGEEIHVDAIPVPLCRFIAHHRRS